MPEPHDQLVALAHKSYREYLKSDHWQKLRADALERYEHRCIRCGSTERLQVHHREYRGPGRERPEDLEVVCRSCHAERHRKPVDRPVQPRSVVLEPDPRFEEDDSPEAHGWWSAYVDEWAENIYGASEPSEVNGYEDHGRES